MSEPDDPAAVKPEVEAQEERAHRGWRDETDFRGRCQRSTLLVVEDCPDDFALLERALQKAGGAAHVCWVQTAAEALALLPKLEAESPTVCVVADLKLPGMDGLELLRLVKNRQGPTRLNFAVLTGRGDPWTQERARGGGADAFFVKPSRCEDLVEVAKSLLGLAESRGD